MAHSIPAMPDGFDALLQQRYAQTMEKLHIGKELLYLSRRDCEAMAPDIPSTLAAVKEALIEHGHKRYEMPAKVGVHPLPDTFYHAMPAYVPGNLTCGMKWIEGYPNNPQAFGLPQTTGLLILNDILTGLPVCVMDCTLVTLLRTPAVTMLSALALHPNAETLTMIGCGAQGLEHVRFFLHTLPKLRRIYVHDTHAPALTRMLQTYERNAQNVELIAQRPFEEMTKQADIICTATKFVTTPSRLIRAEWAQSGQTFLPQESFSVVAPEIGQICDRFITDSIDEAMLFDSMGYFPLGLPEIACETGEMLAGLKPGRENAQQIIVCNNIGMAVNDLAVARLIYDHALAQGAGRILPL